MKPLIGAQLYTVRDYARTPEEIRDTFIKIKNIGYTTVQVSGLGAIAPERMKDILDETGLTISLTHVAYDRLINDLPGLIKEHKLWGCKHMGLGAMPAEFRTLDGLMRFCEIFNSVCKSLASEDMKFYYHNHRFELEKFGSKTMLDIIAENTDPSVFGFTLDFYWLVAGGGNPATWIKKLAGRIENIHLKDMRVVNDRADMCEVGLGNLDWLDILTVGEKYGTKNAFVEQDICDKNPFDSLDISLKYLNSIGYR